jgi:hypothetical protein
MKEQTIVKSKTKEHENQFIIHKSICKSLADGNETRQTIDLGITLSQTVS